MSGSTETFGQTDYFEIGVNLAAKLPEGTSATAEPNVHRILRGMAKYLYENEDLRAGGGRMGASLLTEQQILGMLTDALDEAR